MFPPVVVTEEQISPRQVCVCAPSTHRCCQLHPDALLNPAAACGQAPALHDAPGGWCEGGFAKKSEQKRNSIC